MNPLPRLTYVDPATYRIQAVKGWVEPFFWHRFQDGLIRSIETTSSLLWTPESVGAGGLDAGPVDEASTWYFLYLVPSGNSLAVVGTKTAPASGGPSGYSNFIYVAALFNSLNSNLYNIRNYGDWFRYAGANEYGRTVHYDSNVSPAVDTWRIFNHYTDTMADSVPAGVADAAIFQCNMDCDSGANSAQIACGFGSTPASAPTSWKQACNATQSNTEDGNEVIRAVGDDVSMYVRNTDRTGPVDHYIRCIGWHDAYRSRR